MKGKGEKTVEQCHKIKKRDKNQYFKAGFNFSTHKFFVFGIFKILQISAQLVPKQEHNNFIGKSILGKFSWKLSKFIK